MHKVAAFFFYTYVGLVGLAGAWGAFGLAPLDFQYLLGLDLSPQEARVQADVLSQYRFLRALELGFFVYAWRYRQVILAGEEHLSLFLTIMGLGIVGRLVGVVYEGSPSWIMWFFLIYEAVGWMAIFEGVRRGG